MLPRSGVPEGDTTDPKSRGLVFPEGDIADPQMSTEATVWLAPSVLAIFRAQAKRIFAPYRQRASEERLEARNHGFGFASYSRRLVSPDGNIAGPNSNMAFGLSLEYSTDKVVLFWPPPFYFPPRSPSSFAVDDMP